MVVNRKPWPNNELHPLGAAGFEPWRDELDRAGSPLRGLLLSAAISRYGGTMKRDYLQAPRPIFLTVVVLFTVLQALSCMDAAEHHNGKSPTAAGAKREVVAAESATSLEGTEAVASVRAELPPLDKKTVPPSPHEERPHLASHKPAEPNTAHENSSGAIYSGFFWEEPLPFVLSHRPIVILRDQQYQEVQHIVHANLTRLSANGWYAGIPDRTLVLPVDSLRLVYGGSMGDEVGFRSIDGTTTLGFVLSLQLVSLLKGVER